MSADQSTEFPIFLDPDLFSAKERDGAPKRGSGLKKMHDMPECAQRSIAALQPYHGRHGPAEFEALWLLHKLSIEDKHHALNLVACGVDARLHIQTSPDIHPGYGLSGQTGFLTLKDGAEAYRVPLPADSSRVQDYSHLTFDIAFDPEGPGRGIRLRQGLRAMRDAVAEAITLLVPHIR